MVEKKIIIDQEKRNKEKEELEDNIFCLVAEKRDISSLLRSAMREKEGAEKGFKELPESNGENQIDSPQSNGTTLDVAERSLQNTGLDFRAGCLAGIQTLYLLMEEKEEKMVLVWYGYLSFKCVVMFVYKLCFLNV